MPVEHAQSDSYLPEQAQSCSEVGSSLLRSIFGVFKIATSQKKKKENDLHDKQTDIRILLPSVFTGLNPHFVKT